jgi:hypothetical protein
MFRSGRSSKLLPRLEVTGQRRAVIRRISSCACLTLVGGFGWGGCHSITNKSSRETRRTCARCKEKVGKAVESSEEALYWAEFFCNWKSYRARWVSLPHQTMRILQLGLLEDVCGSE